MKKILAAASAITLLATQFLPTALPVAQAVSNASQCLPASSAYTIESIQTLGNGNLQVVLVYSDAMMGNSVWRDSKVRFYARERTTVTSGGYYNSGDMDMWFANQTPNSFNGNRATFVLPTPPETYQYYDSRVITEPSANLTVLPEAAYYPSGYYAVNYYFCDGFTKAKKIPVTKSYSFLGNSGQTYTITYSDSTTIENQGTVQLNSPANSSVIVNGQSVNTGNSITLTGLANYAPINLSADGLNTDFIRPSRGEADGGMYPYISNITWQGTSNISVDVTESLYWVNDCNNYCAGSRMPDVFRYIYNDGTLSGWTPLGSYTTRQASVSPPIRINTYYLTPPANVQSIMIGYNTSFRIYNNYYPRTEAYNKTASGVTRSLPNPPDTTLPVFSTTQPFVINNNDATVSNSTGRVNLSPIVATDNSGGALTCSVSNSPTGPWTAKTCNTPITNWEVSIAASGRKDVYARACDASNNCAVTSDSIVWYDTDYDSEYCLKPSNGFTLDSIHDLGNNQFELRMTMSAGLMANSTWRNSKYRVAIGTDSTYDWPGSREDDKVIGDNLTPTFVPNTNQMTLRVTLSENDRRLDYWSSGDHHQNLMTRYITVTSVKAMYEVPNEDDGICSGFTYGMKIPASRSYTFQDIRDRSYTVTARDVEGNEGSVAVTLDSPVPEGEVRIQGQAIAQGQTITITNLPLHGVINVEVPGETFQYSFVRPGWADELGNTSLSLRSSGLTRPSTDTAVFEFNRAPRGDGGHQSQNYTHYRYIEGTTNAQGQFQETSRSGWLAIPANAIDNYGTDNRYQRLTLTGLPEYTAKIYLTATPSRVYDRMYESGSDNDNFYTDYVLNQISAITTFSPDLPPDVTAPSVGGFDVGASVSNTYVNTRTIQVTPNINEDRLGELTCYAGRTETSVDTVVPCAGFPWDLFGTATPTEGEVSLYFRAVDTSNNSSNIVSLTVYYDPTAPEVTQASLFQDFPWTTAPYQLVLTPDDGEGSGGSTIYYSLSDEDPGTCGTPNTAFTAAVTMDHPQYLCYMAEDALHNRSVVAGPFLIRVDGENPVITDMHVEVDGERVTPQNQISYLQSTSGNVRFTVSDEHSGVDGESCTASVDGVALPAESCTITNGIANISIPPTLTEGLHVFRAAIEDTVGHPTEATINIFVDSHNPEFSVGTADGRIGVQLIEPSRRMTVTLPASFEDNGGEDALSNSGIATAHIRLGLENNIGTLALTEANIQDWNAATMRLENNTLILTPASTTPTFPATVTFTGLPDETQAQEQLSYSVDFNAFDYAGRGLVDPDGTLHRGNLRFDTLAPTVGGFTRLGASTRLGTGTQEDPFRVGADLSLRGRILVNERTNNTVNLPSTPITYASIRTFVHNGDLIPNGITAQNVPVCAHGSLDINLGCSLVGSFGISENFNGRVEIVIRDNAENTSTPVTFWVKQDSNRPQLLENFTLTSNLAPGEHFKGNLYRFTADGIDKRGDDKRLTAFVTYRNTAGEAVTLSSSMTEAATNRYTFEVALGGVSEGAQVLDIYFEDNYGNRHQVGEDPAEHLVHYDIFHDSLAPTVAGFDYTWTDDDVNVSFFGITDLSFPVRIETESSADGQTWTAFGTPLVRQDGTGTNFILENVPAGQQLRVRFGDTVKDYIEGAIADSTTPSTFYIVRDMVLSVEEGNERLNVGYVPETTLNVNRIAGYDVSYTGPHGRTGTFTSPTTFEQIGGPLGTIDSPLIGEYTFTTRLRYNDGTPDLVTTKTYDQQTDILNPRATLSIPEITDAVRFDEDTNTYYVTSNSTELALNYTVAPQYQGTTTIYDDSLPIRLRTEGADINIENAEIALPDGTVTIELLEDRLYTVQGVFTDQSGRSVSQSFNIRKDRAQPMIQTRFVTTDSGEQLTMTSNDASDPAQTYMTRAAEMYLDVIVLNEDEPVTLAATIGETALTGAEEVPNLLAGQQGARYRLTNLPDNDITHITVNATDRALLTRTGIAHIRRDNAAPALTGDVVLNDVYTQNPLPLDVEARDYTQVSYVVGYTLNGEAATAEAQPYNNAIALPEGDLSNITLLFRDALGNETQTYTFPNTNIHVDSVRPAGTLSLNPSGATNQPTVDLMIADIVEAGPELRWEAAISGNIVSSGTVMRADFASTSRLGAIPLQLNRENAIDVVLRDSVNNTSSGTTLRILQDNAGPVAVFTVHATAGTTPYVWNYTVSDGDGVGLESPATARILDISNGRYMDGGSHAYNSETGAYTSAWTEPEIIPGHRYVLEVTAADRLNNSAVTRSNALELPRGPMDEGDPLQDPIDIPDGITGDRITVTVSNGRNIIYVAENMPRGEHLYLADVLELGRNTVNNTVLTKFPVGLYDITIVDNENNTASIPEYLVRPYYFDADGDVDGNGFGGGITDQKLVKAAEEAGNVYTEPTSTRLQEIKDRIAENIISSMPIFLSDGLWIQGLVMSPENPLCCVVPTSGGETVRF